MKLYLNNPNEEWIVDRLCQEWNQHNSIFSTNDPSKADLLWIISPWSASNISKKFLREKKVVCTIHHIDFDKFDFNEKRKFKKLDKYVDFYHVISDQTENDLKKITDKEIWNNPWWIDSKLWYEINEKKELRRKYNIDQESYLVGSFQRDTEGADLKSPKLSTGPDRFITIVKALSKEFPNLEVVLAGKRREYVLKQLKQEKIKFYYFEMVEPKLLNELYNMLNLYVVSSRIEGGPQAIYECSLSKTPIISTNVGVATKFLHPSSIFKMDNFMEAKPNTEYAYDKIQTQIIPEGFTPFINKFEVYLES